MNTKYVRKNTHLHVHTFTHTHLMIVSKLGLYLVYICGQSIGAFFSLKKIYSPLKISANFVTKITKFHVLSKKVIEYNDVSHF